MECPHCHQETWQFAVRCTKCGAKIDPGVKTPVQMTAPPGSTAYIPFRFTGKSSEYFQIWVINIFLTILTLGIYSAWAKVRKKRYFYGNTFLQEDSFDYLADPRKILKGRLIVFGALVVLLVTVYFLPYLRLILLIPAIALLPWLVVKSLSFRARNSSYRNIRFNFSGTYGQAMRCGSRGTLGTSCRRFNFSGTYGQAMRVYIGQPIITSLTLGLGYPYQPYWRNMFLINNSVYGTTPFTFWGKVGSFYRIYFWQAPGLAILVGIFTYIAPTVGQSLLPASAYQLFGLLISLLAVLTLIAFVRAAVTNLVWSNVALGDHLFKSTLSISKMIWIYLSNAIAILFSLGLLIPWASVRMARYRLANLCVYASGELDNLVASEQEKISAVGEEILDFFDFDVGL
ncbi:hypothetical protein NKDENANG_01367 [Candidatus Entotheonellaceae bacterium PAL068K]